MFVRANFMDIYLQGMLDRSMRSGTELAREIKLTDWSMAGNPSNRSSGVQIPRDICTRYKRYLYSAKCSWIIKVSIMFRFTTLSVRVTYPCLWPALAMVVGSGRLTTGIGQLLMMATSLASCTGCPGCPPSCPISF